MCAEHKSQHVGRIFSVVNGDLVNYVKRVLKAVFTVQSVSIGLSHKSARYNTMFEEATCYDPFRAFFPF